MNLQQYLTPQNATLAAGITGGIIALALIGLAIWNRRTLAKGVTGLWQSIFSQGGLFYVGMGLFMLASVVEAILSLVRAGRPETSDVPDVTKHVVWGPGPRASQALMLAVRARAVMDGRLAPSVDDVLALAHPVLRHRMALNFAARADGVTMDKVIDRLCQPLA